MTKEQHINNQVNRVLDMAWDGHIPVDPEYIGGCVKIKRVDASGNPVSHEIRVEPSHLGDESGYAVMLVNEPAQVFLCVYNDDEIKWRQRFTIAHELGHILLGHVDSTGNAKHDMDFNPNGDSDEKEANCFATALLMPKQIMNRLVHKGYSILELSRHFNVSPTTIRFRLQELNHL